MRHAMGTARVDGIAALGRIDYVAVGLEDFGKAENYLERQVDRWRRQLASYKKYAAWPGPGTLPDVERIARFYHLANVMLAHSSARLAAIVDWELSTTGDPLLDLGWLLATWKGADGNELDGLVVEPWEGFPTFAIGSVSLPCSVAALRDYPPRGNFQPFRGGKHAIV